MVNKMGEAVAKTAKLAKKLEKIEWYTGVYFLYKRFFLERKRIERFLEESVPKLTRHEPFGQQEWNEWLMKDERELMLEKCKTDNENIEVSIRRMAKKMEGKQLPPRVMNNAPLSRQNAESTRIAVEFVVDEYDQAVEQQLLGDPDIYTHLCEMINAIYVMAELDGKLQEKKPVTEYCKVKRPQDELNSLVERLYEYYEADD